MYRARSLKRLTLIALALLLAAQGAVLAQTSPALDRITQSGKVRVGMSGNQPPFNATSREGQLIGMEVSFARLLAGSMGAELEIVTKPFGELLSALHAGEVDMVMSGMSINAERARTTAFVGPYAMAGKSILTKSDTLAAARSVGDLNKADLKLAALENSTSQAFVERHVTEAQLVKIQDYDSGVQMLIDGEIDALVADMPICVLSVMRYPEANLATLTQPLTIEPIGIAVAAGDPLFTGLLRNYLAAFEGVGALEQLRKTWMEDDSWVAALP
jgi:ABC-type amino acid transport substrate-binding protein